MPTHCTSPQTELDANSAQVKSTAAEKVTALEALSAKLSQAGVKDNRHTTLTLDSIHDIAAQLNGACESVRHYYSPFSCRTSTHHPLPLTEAVSQRESAYTAELAKQRSFDEKRREFAEQATSFVNFVAQQRATLEKLDGDSDQVLELYLLWYLLLYTSVHLFLILNMDIP